MEDGERKTTDTSSIVSSCKVTGRKQRLTSSQRCFTAGSKYCYGEKAFIKNMENKYFDIIETRETPTGKIHSIAWSHFMPRKLLRALARHAIQVGWMQSGQYMISNKKKTEILIDDRIQNDFSILLSFLSRKYVE